MKKILLGLLAFIICVGAATQRAGWSYSGRNTFRITEEAEVKLYHDPKRSFPYEGDLVEDDIIFDKLLKPGKYVLTVEGYYHMDVK